MKEEIKELLETIKECIAKNDDNIESFIIDITKWKELLDYITNLQKENKIQKEKIEHLLIDLRGESEYKQRIEKAIEELDKYINSCGIEVEHTLNNEKCLISIRHSKKIKNILKGDKDE